MSTYPICGEETNKTEPPSTMDHHHESYSTRDETLCFQRPSPQTVYVMYQVREVWNVSKAGPPRLTTTGSDLYRVSREPLEKQGMSTNHHHQPGSKPYYLMNLMPTWSYLPIILNKA
ncbi:unnamed protein product [Brassica rapa subsp. trilocularis]